MSYGGHSWSEFSPRSAQTYAPTIKLVSSNTTLDSRQCWERENDKVKRLQYMAQERLGTMVLW